MYPQLGVSEGVSETDTRKAYDTVGGVSFPAALIRLKLGLSATAGCSTTPTNVPRRLSSHI